VDADNRCDSLVIDSALLEKKFNIDSFQIISNMKFSGVLRVDKHPSQKKIIAVAGRYDAKKNDYSTFVIILSCSSKSGLNLEAKFDFYTDTIDFLAFKDNKIYVVFKDETELFGWIQWQDGQFSFVMFEDPEL
jgi:hypothetical protein